MSESEERLRVVAEARKWLGTPFRLNAMIPGPAGGVDCLRLISRAFGDSGVIPELAASDPWPHHEIQHSQHSRDEILIGYVERYATEAGRSPLAADIVLIRRREDLCFAHAGLVTEWPRVIHVMDSERGVREQNSLLFRRWNPEFRFFSVWPRGI